jgi:hypothetical protein
MSTTKLLTPAQARVLSKLREAGKRFAAGVRPATVGTQTLMMNSLARRGFARQCGSAGTNYSGRVIRSALWEITGAGLDALADWQAAQPEPKL